MKIFVILLSFVIFTIVFAKIVGEEKIVGGQEATPNSIPYQVLLPVTTFSGTSIVGGSLISRSYVLSAASVLYRATSVDVFLGKHNLTYVEDTELKITSTNIIIHDKWTESTLANDIALIVLPKPIKLTPQIAVVPLPKYSDVGDDYLNAETRISGWGKKASHETTASEVLRYVDVQIMENVFCKMIFPGVANDILCTRGDGLKGFCVGDSGGPLVHDGVQIGIASLTSWYTCSEGWPSVHTRVWSYLDWIADNTDVEIQQ